MAFTKKNYVDLTGLSTFKSSLLGTVINDTNKTTTSKTATIKAITDYVDSEVGDLSSAVTEGLANKVSSVTYDSTNKKIVYNKGGSTNTDVVTVATIKSAIGNFVKSGTGASSGLVPAPSTTAGSSKYLREDGTWVTPPNTTYSVFGKSGSTASTGLVPKPDTTAGSSKYLREDGTWATPPDTNTTYDNATTSKAGLMGADDKAKLNSIAAGAEVNQNAFSNVKVGNVTIEADSKTDTLTLVAGSNVTITPDSANDKITISSSYTNTTYSAGTDLSLSDTTFNHANSGVTAGTYRSVTVNARGHVTAGSSPTTLSGYGITDAKIANGVITLGSNTITPLTSSSSLNASKLTGTISVDRLPATALERCVVVANDTARFALTVSNVQVGDTVKVTATKKMYMVVDSSKLSTEAGYEEYFTSTDWSTITNKPSSYYTHPAYTAQKSGLYKITVDALGHVSGVTSVTKADITGLGIPGSDTQVTSAVGNTTKAYLVGSTSSSDATGTLIKDTNVYLDTTAGQLVATTFSGSLAGNATSSSSIIANAQLGTKEAIDGFLEGNKLKYTSFTNYSDIGFGGNDGMILSIPWPSNTAYGAQIAFDDSTSGLVKVRGKSSTWGSWKQLWKEGDSITAPSVTATNGFTGNLTGNADTATKLGTSNVGSNTTPIYLSAGAPTASSYTISKSVPSDAVFTDTKVTQNAVTDSDYTNFRPLIFGSSNSGTAGFTPSTVTDGVYACKGLYVRPSAGLIHATTFEGDLSDVSKVKVSGKVTLQYNSSTESLDFVFA